MATEYNPNILRQILDQISQGRNLGLPELSGETREQTLQKLLWNPVLAEQKAQATSQQVSDGSYVQPEMPNMQLPEYSQPQAMQAEAVQPTMPDYKTDWARVARGAGVGLLKTGLNPFGALYGGMDIYNQQRQGNIARSIYNELGFKVPEELQSEFVPQFVKSSLETREEYRKQTKANLDNLETELKAQKMFIENSYLPEEKKAELKKKINDAEKSIYEAQKSKSDAKFSDALNSASVAQRQAGAALSSATIPLRKAQTQQAQQQIAAGLTPNGVPLKPLSNEAANGLANALQGIDSITQLRQFEGKGKSLYANPQERIKYENYKDNVYDILARLRTGAAISKNEEALYKRQIPTVEDFAFLPEQATQKMNTFTKLMSDKVRGIDPAGHHVYNLRGTTIDRLATPKPKLTKEQALQLAKQRGLIK